MTLPRTILVPIDFSPYAETALDYAVGLAQRLDGTIHLVHAITVPAMGIPEMGVAYSAMTMETTTKEAQTALDAMAAKLRGKVGLGPTRLEIGDPRDVIDTVAQTVGADLIVMGTHGRRGVRRFMMGSVAESVVRSAPCPVLTVGPKRS